MKTRKNPLLPVITILLLALIFLLATGRLMDVVEEVTFYWFDHTETELKVKAYAEEHHIFYSEYPDSLVALLERNPETEDFVLRYPFREDLPYDLSEFADAESVPLRKQLIKNYTPLQGFCIMLFCLLSIPCLATLAVTRREMNSWKMAGVEAAGLFILAYIVTFTVYHIGLLLDIGNKIIG